MIYTRSRASHLRHRAQLLRALRDLEAGKSAHLAREEKAILKASINKRIADINAQLNEANDG